MTELRFEEASHTYTLGGIVLPSVTKVLKVLPSAYAMVDPDVLERAAGIGRAVHKIIEDDVRGQLDEEAVDFDLLPYLDQWRTFLTTSGFQPVHTELRVHSPRYGYAGTLDLMGTLRGRWALIDAKRTAAVPRSAGPQTAGYEIAARECMPELEGTRIDRFALHLTPDRWQLVPFKDAADQRVFLAALSIHKWSNAK